jgi:hypothetical protein
MTLTVPLVIFFVGLALIVIAIFGGGLEIKELKVPTLPTIPRTLSGGLGLVLILMSFFPGFLPTGETHATSTPNPANTPSVPSTPSVPTTTVVYGSIPIHYAEDQRAFALRLRDYLAAKGYAVSATEDDFSQIPATDREQPGTVRVVYRSSARGVEERVLDAMRGQFPNIPRWTERPSNTANVDLQIQVW